MGAYEPGGPGYEDTHIAPLSQVSVRLRPSANKLLNRSMGRLSYSEGDSIEDLQLEGNSSVW